MTRLRQNNLLRQGYDSQLNPQSSNAGGLNTSDSTSRLVTKSYQKAQRLAANGTSPGHFGETIRLDLNHAQAKNAIAFREDYLGSGAPRTVAWLVAHGASNDDPNVWHNHFSVEIPDENGSLQTAMEWPFAPFNTANGYGHAVSGHYTRSTRKLIASNMGLTIENAAGNDRNIHFSSGSYGADADRRWSVQVDNVAEGGSNAGSNFRISRRSDTGVFIATPFYIRRSDGQIGINNNSPTQALDVGGTVKGTGMMQNILTKTANYTLLSSDFTILFDATGGNLTATLQAAASHAGRVYIIKKIDASGNTVTIDANGSETIDGATTNVLSAQWQTVRIQSDGTAWYVI
jgi:hypothetical protein